jgi:hypothetical protein
MHDERLKKLSRELNDDAEATKGLVEDLKIENDEDLLMAVQWTAELKKRAKEIEAKKKEVTRPIGEGLDKITKFFKAPLDTLEKTEKIAKKLIEKHISVRISNRDDILKSIEFLSEEDRPEAIEKASKLIPPKIPGLSIRETWTGKVSDPDKLLEWIIEHKKYEYLQINIKALEQCTKSLKENPEIPGWRAYIKRIVVIGDKNGGN